MLLNRIASIAPRAGQASCAILLASATTLSAWAQVNGDECSNALPVFNGVNAQVDLANFTHSTTLPLPDCGSGWDVTKDVWYRYDAPVGGRVLVELHGSTLDTILAVYSGECGALTLLGCDDDDTSVSSATSRLVEIPVTKGKVFLRIGGFNGATGTIALRFNYEAIGAVKIWGDDTSVSSPPGSFFNIPQMPSGALAVACAYNSLFQGIEHALARTPEGRVVWWGNALTDIPSQLPESAIAIACGDYHNIVLRDENTPTGVSGQVVCWGCGSPSGGCQGASYGQSTPPAAAASGVRSIAAGRLFSIASKANGSVLTWGDQTAPGMLLSVPATATGVSVVGAGDFHALAIKRDGTLIAWGNNSYGQATVPSTLGPVLAAEGSERNTIALRQNRSVAVWGDNNSGQLSIPASVTSNGAVAVAAGSYGYGTCAALLTNGEVAVWGSHASAFESGPAGPYASFDIDDHSIAVSRRDCNFNGISDDLEISDCDQDGVPDCEEIAAGTIEDCNDNGLADACEKQSALSLSSGQLGPIGYKSPQSWTISQAVPAVEPVTLRVRAKGDFSAYLEHVTLSCGNQFLETALGGTDDCLASPPWQTFTLTPEQFNAGIATDGTWRLDMVATIAVDPALCGGTSWIEATVGYTGSNSADCNSNSLLDSCEIANGWAADTNGNGVPDSCDSALSSCPTDSDRDGQTGASDLSGLLLAWGSASANFDFDGNGSVGASDLSVLLLAWGPCAEK